MKKPPDARATPPRGVYKAPDPVAWGYTVYTIVLSSGKVIQSRMPSDLADWRMDEHAHQLLDLRDPERPAPRLRLIR